MDATCGTNHLNPFFATAVTKSEQISFNLDFDFDTTFVYRYRVFFLKIPKLTFCAQRAFRQLCWYSLWRLAARTFGRYPIESETKSY